MKKNNKKMRALVVAPQPFFSPRGTPFSVYYRTLVTAELGVEIDLLTYGAGQDVDIPGVRIVRIPQFGFLGNVKIGPSLLKLFLDQFLLLWTIILLLCNKYDFVHAHEEAVFFCRFLKHLFRFKMIYDMHSSLPQQLTNFKYTTSKVLIGIFEKLEKSCLLTADAIITICPDLAEYVTSINGTHNKHFLIENSIFDQVKLLSPLSNAKEASTQVDISSKPADLPQGKRFVVYAGTLEPYQGIDMLIEAFKTVVSSDPDAFLLIVGGTDSQVKKYSSLANSDGLGPHSLFTGLVPQALAKHYSQLATVLVSPRIEGTNTPLKIYEQLASGIPLVATKIFSHTQVLDDTVAFLVDPDPESMSSGLLAALSSDKESTRIATNARSLYEQKYSRPVYLNKMRKLLELLS